LYCAGFEVLSLNSSALDITDRDALSKAAEDFSPDIIVNCSAYTKVDKAEEESELAFRKGEEEILRSGCDSIIIRTSWLYGTGGKNFVKTILALAKERELLKVVDDQIGSPTWTGDLAGAIVHLATKKISGDTKTGIYNYTNRSTDGISWYDFAKAIIEEARECGEELKCTNVEPIPSSEYPTPAKRPAYSVLSTEKFERDFDILIEPWRGSLRKMLIELQGARDA
jgi:dTDP-4-dehydrorhamnose reductase